MERLEKATELDLNDYKAIKIELHGGYTYTIYKLIETGDESKKLESFSTVGDQDPYEQYQIQKKELLK